MLVKKYLDRHGDEIMAGMTLRHRNGDTEMVYATTDAYGNDDLGVSATNPVFLERHPDWDEEYYSLSSFDLKEWEIVK